MATEGTHLGQQLFDQRFRRKRPVGGEQGAEASNVEIFPLWVLASVTPSVYSNSLSPAASSMLLSSKSTSRRTPSTRPSASRGVQVASPSRNSNAKLWPALAYFNVRVSDRYSDKTS